MTEKFTQGEWDWFISDNGDGFPIIYSGDTDIAEVYLPNGNSEQMLNNAALIAAAPEMYAMLKLMTEPTFMGATIPQYLRTAIEAVLKKARGEE